MENAILVLGGSCFMGKRLVERIRQVFPPDLVVVTVNRGNIYWGNRASPFIQCDRKKDRCGYRNRLLQIIPNYKWVGVIDFCAFKSRDISESLPVDVFNGEVFPMYILISTDSVYEVVDLGGVTQVDESLNVTAKYPSRDRYGFNKLKVEETARALSSDSQSLLILRLPDVIGPFDDTYRLWMYCEWLKSGNDVYVPPGNIKLAFVYSEDVVEFCLGLVCNVPRGCKETLNVLCDEQVGLQEFLRIVADCLECELRVANTCSPRTFYPSVEYRTVPLSGERAKRMFGFKPTPLCEAVKHTVCWLSTAQSMYPAEYSEMRHSL